MIDDKKIDLTRGDLFQNDLAIIAVNIAPSFASFGVLLSVTLSTQQLKIVEVQSDLRPVYVRRCQLLDVMHDHARLVYSFTHTVLTQMMSALCVFIPAVLPRLRTVEFSSERFSHLSDQAPPVALRPRPYCRGSSSVKPSETLDHTLLVCSRGSLPR